MAQGMVLESVSPGAFAPVYSRLIVGSIDTWNEVTIEKTVISLTV